MSVFLPVRCRCGRWMAGIREDSNEPIEARCRCGRRWYAQVVDGEVNLVERKQPKELVRK